MTVPSMVQAHAARELHIGRKAKSDLGTTAGYTWASVVSHVVFGGDDADSPETSDNEVTLANGKTIVLTNTKIITKLSNNSVASVINKAEQQKGQDAQQTGKPGGSGSSGSSSDSSGGGSGSAPPLAVDLRVMARRTAVPAGTRARVVSRLPRKRVSTAGS